MLHMTGALVNGHRVKPTYELQHFDHVEIITHPDAMPSPQWLKCANRPSTKRTLRDFFKKEAATEGRVMSLAYLENDTLGSAPFGQVHLAEDSDSGASASWMPHWSDVGLLVGARMHTEDLKALAQVRGEEATEEASTATNSRPARPLASDHPQPSSQHVSVIQSDSQLLESEVLRSRGDGKRKKDSESDDKEKSQLVVDALMQELIAAKTKYDSLEDFYADAAQRLCSNPSCNVLGCEATRNDSQSEASAALAVPPKYCTKEVDDTLAAMFNLQHQGVMTVVNGASVPETFPRDVGDEDRFVIVHPRDARLPFWEGGDTGADPRDAVPRSASDVQEVWQVDGFLAETAKSFRDETSAALSADAGAAQDDGGEDGEAAPKLSKKRAQRIQLGRWLVRDALARLDTITGQNITVTMGRYIRASRLPAATSELLKSFQLDLARRSLSALNRYLDQFPQWVRHRLQTIPGGQSTASMPSPISFPTLRDLFILFRDVQSLRQKEAQWGGKEAECPSLGSIIEGIYAPLRRPSKLKTAKVFTAANETETSTPVGAPASQPGDAIVRRQRRRKARPHGLLKDKLHQELGLKRHSKQRRKEVGKIDVGVDGQLSLWSPSMEMQQQDHQQGGPFPSSASVYRDVTGSRRQFVEKALQEIFAGSQSEQEPPAMTRKEKRVPVGV
mmetsp:Transcript_45037/g.111856  ORF Transcript_45037/g.111856 Transcript_45037/m.111856 type:complete len:675 (+) Transcript_45037:1-2025(+)